MLESLTSIGSSASPDLPSIVANISIFVLFLGAIVAGVAKGLKEIKDLKPSTDKAAVAGAMILENATIRDWSESNTIVARRLEDVCDVSEELRRALREVSEELRATRNELNTLNHSRNRG